MIVEAAYLLVALMLPTPTLHFHQIHAYRTMAECQTALRAQPPKEGWAYSCYPQSELLKHVHDKPPQFKAQ